VGWELSGEFAEELFERRNGGGGEIWAGDCYIRVEVGNGAVEALAVLLKPIR